MAIKNELKNKIHTAPCCTWEGGVHAKDKLSSIIFHAEYDQMHDSITSQVDARNACRYFRSMIFLIANARQGNTRNFF